LEQETPAWLSAKEATRHEDWNGGSHCELPQ
jgi:hypothetical protein